MPFIDSKITVSLTPEKEEAIKTKLGQASPSAYSEMTKVICDILSEELSIPGNQVYVTYHGVNDWGWNGSNF